MGREETHQNTELDLEQLIASLERRDMPLPFEIGSFIVLEVCEAQREHPRVVDAVDVLLSDAGQVLLSTSARAADEQAASRAAITLLRRVLAVAEPETPPGLMELVKHGPAGGWDLTALHDDLEALLVPLNRAAVRRVLARMVRDARRSQGASGGASGEMGEPSSDTPQPLAAEHAELPAAEQLDARFDRWLEHQVQAEARGEQPHAADPEVERLEEEGSPGSRRGPWLIGLLIFAIVLSVLLGLRRGALFASRGAPSRATSISGHPDAGPADAGAVKGAERRGREPDAGVPRGAVVFRSNPSGAQVLLDLGRAPLEIPGLAVGVAHELVGLIRGRAPVRAVIPADAEWRRDRLGPRFELTLSIPPSGADAATAALGSTRLPDELGRPSRERGLVRVRSRPRGARVYRLMGFTPDARVEGVPTDRVTHFLLHHPARGTRDIVIEPRRWQRDGGAAVLEIDVAMPR